MIAPTDNSEIIIRKLADNHSEIEYLKTDKNSEKVLHFHNQKN